jgi:hypothetical protein
MRSLLANCGSRAVLAQDPDDDPPRVRVLSQRFDTARKQHACSMCPEGGILPGQRYERLTLLEDDKLACLVLCLPGECSQNRGGRA